MLITRNQWEFAKFSAIFAMAMVISANFAEISAVGFVECGTRETEDEGPSAIVFIADGQRVELHEFPWMVSIRKGGSDGFKHSCGGTLIQSKIVLTAAHCLFEDEYSNGRLQRRLLTSNAFQVVTGSHYLDKAIKGEKSHSIQRIIIHPAFNVINANDFKNDLAILVLDDEVDSSRPEVKAACLADQEFEKEVMNSSRKASCHVIGWGDNPYDRRAQVSNELKYRQVPILDSDYCRKEWRDEEFDGQSMFCGGKTDKGVDAAGPCGGDSGGPLMCTIDDRTYHLVGIISWGHMFCMRRPAVFLRTSHYFDWIVRQGTEFPLSAKEETSVTQKPRPKVRPLATCRLDSFRMNKYLYISANEVYGESRVEVAHFRECLERCCAKPDKCSSATYNVRERWCTLNSITSCEADENKQSLRTKQTIVFDRRTELPEDDCRERRRQK